MAVRLSTSACDILDNLVKTVVDAGTGEGRIEIRTAVPLSIVVLAG